MSFAEMGLAAVGLEVMGFTETGLAEVGLEVMGFAVMGLAVVRLDVMGFAVRGDVLKQLQPDVPSPALAFEGSPVTARILFHSAEALGWVVNMLFSKSQ
jgi:hypothetical protein